MTVSVELAKTIIPAIISSFAVTFYFQKRLTRIGDFKETTNLLLKRLTEGTEEVYNAAQGVDSAVARLRAVLQTKSFDVMEIVEHRRELGSDIVYLKNSIDAHRIYIISIFPFGSSSEMAHSIYAVLYDLEALVQDLQDHPDSAEKRRDHVTEIMEHLKRWDTEYEKLREAIKASQRRILEGKVP